MKVNLPEPIRIVCAGQDMLFAVSYTSKVYAWKPYDPSWYVKIDGLFDSYEEKHKCESSTNLTEE